MTKRPLLQIPSTTQAVVGDETLAIRHDGDVVLEQAVGRRLVRLEATGDATLRGFRASGTLRVGGTLTLHGPADLDDAHADVIVVGDVELTARALVATTRIVVGKAALNVDVVSAPEVVVHADATGRVRLLDCLHEIPATRVRGCLSAAEYDADFGGAADFLARRGVKPLGPLTAPVAAPTAVDPAPAPELDEALLDELTALAPEPVEDLPHLPDAEVEVAPAPVDEAPPPFVVRAAGEPAVPLLPEVEPDVDDPSDEATVPPPRRAPTRAAKSVDRAVARFEAAYGTEPPPPVGELLGLLRRGRTHLVAGKIDDLWVATLRDHLARKAAMPHGVILAFHALRDARDRS